MIVTKQELATILSDNFRETLISDHSLYDKFIIVLEWVDEEPRDITPQDIMSVEDLIAEDLDGLLGRLEKIL